MAVQIKDLVNPATTAVLCMEMQRGVVGDMSPIPQLVAAVSGSGMVNRLAAFLAAARAAGVQVVYCNALHRKDWKGSPGNSPMLARSAKTRDTMIEGTPSAQNVSEIAPQEGDFVSGRYHGMSPFTGTSLDVTLRAMGIKNVIATGVSLNVGIMGMAIEAVALGYNVVVARDCVAGLPAEHAESILKHSLPVLGAVVPGDDIKAAWASK